MAMIKKLEQYLAKRSLVWSPTTLKSERSRLTRLLLSVPTLEPELLWKYVERSLSPYSRLTAWSRAVKFAEFADPKVEKALVEFRRSNPQLFRNTYLRKVPELSFSECVDTLSDIEDEPARNVALALLQSGLRVSELSKVQDGYVVGKGRKLRKVYLDYSPPPVPYKRLYSALKGVGLKPHDLRKIFLTRLVELGAGEFELLEVAGWNSIATASSYVRASKSRVSELMEKLQL